LNGNYSAEVIIRRAQIIGLRPPSVPIDHGELHPADHFGDRDCGLS